MARLTDVVLHPSMAKKTLEYLTFDNSYARLPEMFYAKYSAGSCWRRAWNRLRFY
jgi:hypothetical protein